MRLTRSIEKGARERPLRDAMVCDGRRTNRVEMRDRVATAAAALRLSGVGAGERVAILADNSDHYIICLFAIWWAGGVINPVNTRWSPAEIAFSLDDSQTRLLIYDDRHASIAFAAQTACSLAVLSLTELVGANPPPIADSARQGEQLAAILYTGGTTGTPKGVMLSHANLLSNGFSTLGSTARPPQSRVLQVAPFFHVGGLGSILQTNVRLATHIILPGFTNEAVMAAIMTEAVTELFLVPTMIQRLIDDPAFSADDAASVRLLMYGAAPIDPALLSRAIAAFPNADFCQVYGMTELSPVVAALPAWCHKGPMADPAKLRATGLPTIAAEVKIVGPDGAELPPNAVGEIVVGGPMVMIGYWNRPEETAKALRDGWMHTGDAGFLDEDGFLYVVDRLKDMVVTGGENVYAAEVEKVILLLPEIASCAVVGLPDPLWGERVHAVIVLQPDSSVDEDAIRSHCRAHIAGYKCPRTIEFRDAMPLSAAGKILKYQLRAVNSAE